jgi:hypothetical protein
MVKMRRRDLDYLHDMVAKVDSRLDDMAETLVKHDANLAEHMRRTALLEQEISPIKKHVYMVQGVGAFIGLLALIATIYGVLNG